MKPYAVRLLMLLTAAAILGTGWRLAQEIRISPPRAVVLPATQRLTAPSPASKVVATYRIMNQGGTDLVLGTPQAGCGCAVVAMSPTVVRPGAFATVTVEGSPMDAGEKNIAVAIPSNSYPDGEVRLNLTMVGLGKPPYVAYGSPAVAFGTVKSPTVTESFYLITRERADEAPWIVGVRSSLPGLKLTGGLAMSQSLGTVVSRHYEFQAELRRPESPGEFTGEILFLPQGGSPPVHRIPVRGVVRDVVFAVPSVLFASIDSRSPAIQLQIALVADDPGFDLEAAPSPENPTFFSIRPVAKTRGRVHFEVSTNRTASGLTSSHLIFLTNHPKKPLVRVPLTVRAAAEASL